VSAGVLLPLLEILTGGRPGPSQGEDIGGGASDATCEAAAWAVENLAVDVAVHGELLRLGVVAALVHLVRTHGGSAGMRAAAACALAALAASRAARSAIASAGGVAALAALADDAARLAAPASVRHGGRPSGVRAAPALVSIPSENNQRSGGMPRGASGAGLADPGEATSSAPHGLGRHNTEGGPALEQPGTCLRSGPASLMELGGWEAAAEAAQLALSCLAAVGSGGVRTTHGSVVSGGGGTTTHGSVEDVGSGSVATAHGSVEERICLPPQDTPSPKATADAAHSADRQHCGHTAPPEGAPDHWRCEGLAGRPAGASIGGANHDTGGGTGGSTGGGNHDYGEANHDTGGGTGAEPGREGVGAQGGAPGLGRARFGRCGGPSLGSPSANECAREAGESCACGACARPRLVPQRPQTVSVVAHAEPPPPAERGADETLAVGNGAGAAGGVAARSCGGLTRGGSAPASRRGLFPEKGAGGMSNVGSGSAHSSRVTSRHTSPPPTPPTPPSPEAYESPIFRQVEGWPRPASGGGKAGDSKVPQSQPSDGGARGVAAPVVVAGGTASEPSGPATR